MKTKKNNSVLHRFSSKGVFPAQFAFSLLIPLRNIFLSPKKLIKRLKLKKTDHVLDVGPGPGYFSVPVARYLNAGQLSLTDIQQEMIDYAKKRLAKRKIFNVEYKIGDGTSLPFPDNSFNVLFLVTVIGEIEHKREYIREFYRVLKPGGVVSISELPGDPDKLTIAEIENLFEGSGFEVAKIYGKKNNFSINFQKNIK